MTREEAIHAIYTMADAIESEFGYGSKTVADHEANQILMALGVEPGELRR